MPDPAEQPTAADLAGRQARLQILMQAEPAKARAELLEVLEVSRRIGADAQTALALLNLAGCAFLQGDYRLMMDLSEDALVASRACGNGSHEARALNSVGLAAQRLGDLPTAMTFMLDSLRLAQTIMDDVGICRTLGNIALLHVHLGEYDVALRLHEQALDLARDIGHHGLTADMLGSVTEDYLYLGDLAHALELAQEAVAYPRRNGLTRYECAARAILGRTLLALGRATAAVRAARCGQRVARWVNDSETFARLLWVEGQGLTALGDLAGAEARLCEAVEIDAQSGNKFHESGVQSALAEVYRRLGAPDRAAQHADRARSLLAEIQGAGTLPGAPGLARPHATARGADRDIAAQAPAAPGQIEGAPPGLGRGHPWTAELLELTRALRRSNAELLHRLSHDPHTGLLNRQQFQAAVQDSLDFLGPDELLGVIAVGVDDLDELTRSYGPQVAAGVCAEVAARLRAATRIGDTAGRTGDDEFAVALAHLAEPADVGDVMSKLAAELCRPFLVQDKVLDIQTCLGSVVAPADGDNADRLVQRAQAAMQHSRSSVTREPAQFTVVLDQAQRARAALAFELRRALEHDEFVLHYQGVFSLRDRSLLGYEGLIRWQHPELGLLGPDAFIPIAEERRHMIDIGDWVLRAACRQAAAWDLATKGLTMAVNVSPLQFAQPDFTTSVRAALEACEVHPSTLVIELTESLMLADPALARRHMEHLVAMGVVLALDDFGTGFSSLAMLQDMPFHTLKVDRHFLTRVGTNDAATRRTRALLESVVAMASSLDLATVAEGIETHEQWELCRELGFDTAQGFWLARPGPAEDAVLLMHLPEQPAPRRPAAFRPSP